MLWAHNMRFLSVFAVVILHVSAGFVSGIDKADFSYGDNSWWAGNIFDSITRWCVPIFVMISGYFLLNNNDNVLTFFKKRLSRIFIPLIFWSAFFSLWVVLRLVITGELSSAPMIIMKNFLLGKPYYHLWYLFMIPLLYASTPYLKLVLRNSEKNVSLLFIIAAFVISASNVLFNYLLSVFDMGKDVDFFINNFLLYIGYFMLGGFIKKYDISIKPSHAIAGLAVFWLITIYGSYIFTYSYFYNYLSINTIASSIYMFFLIMNAFNYNILKSSAKLAGLSFGIYLVHPVFIDIITFTIRDSILLILNPYIYIILVSIIVFTMSLLSAILMSKNKYLERCI